jgi:hypothetical protein
MAVQIASGAVAVSFATSGQQFSVTADALQSGAADGNGIGFYQFGAPTYTGAGSPQANAESVIPNATLLNMCQSVSVGPVNLRITAGTVAGHPVQATNMVVDASDLTATSALFTNINIGQDMGQFSSPALTQATSRGAGQNVNTGNVPAGTFGQTANTVVLGGLRQTTNATSASTFQLPNLHVFFGSPC